MSRVRGHRSACQSRSWITSPFGAMSEIRNACPSLHTNVGFQVVGRSNCKRAGCSHRASQLRHTGDTAHARAPRNRPATLVGRCAQSIPPPHPSPPIRQFAHLSPSGSPTTSATEIQPVPHSIDSMGREGGRTLASAIGISYRSVSVASPRSQVSLSVP